MNETELNDIRVGVARWKSAIGPGGDKAWMAGQLARDVDPLLAEVDRLTSEAAEQAVKCNNDRFELLAKIADAWDEGAAKAGENHYMMRNGMVPNPYRSLAEGKTE